MAFIALSRDRADQTSLALNQPSGLEVGNAITQKQFLGTKAEVFREFEQLWHSFWGRHADTPLDRWKPFISFCKEHCTSSKQMKFQPLTLERWQKATRLRKKRSATGPDGVSRDDLINLTVNETRAIVSLLNQIEQGSPWPPQLLTGLISSLEKKETSEFVGDFRPICVLSAIYRTWSSIRAREGFEISCQSCTS